MNRVSHGIVGFGILLFLVVPAVAQSQGGGSQQVPPMTNLQVSRRTRHRPRSFKP